MHILLKLYISIISTFILPLKAKASILDTVLNINKPNKTVYENLKQISRMTGYCFTYNAKLFDDQRFVKRTFQSTPLKEIIKKLVSNTKIEIRIIDNQIVLYNNKQSIKKKEIWQYIDTIKYHTINGTIYDKGMLTRLPFVNISLKNKGKGTIANELGEFSFKIRDLNLNDTIILSFIGYRNLSIRIDSAIKKKNFYLESKLVSLQEVIIRNSTPDMIIKTALYKIRNNYYIQPVQLKSFYREVIRKEQKYVQLTEAVVSIYKSAYNKLFDIDRASVLKSRKFINTNLLDTVLIKVKAGMETCLRLDIIKTRPEFLNQERNLFYTYKITDMVNIDNEPAYEIEFSPKLIDEKIVYTGKLYINSINHSILRGEFEIAPRSLSKNKKKFIIKTTRSIKVKPVRVQYMFSYKEFKGKRFLNHVRGRLKLKIKKKRKLFFTNYDTFFELAVNKLDTININKFDKKERLNIRKVFSDQQLKYDASFWERYQFIRPEQPILDALKIMNLQ